MKQHKRLIKPKGNEQEENDERFPLKEKIICVTGGGTVAVGRKIRTGSRRISIPSGERQQRDGPGWKRSKEKVVLKGTMRKRMKRSEQGFKDHDS